MENLIESSFNKHYQNIQSFKNQYLNMIRSVLKRKDDLTFEEIMKFNNLENQLYNLRKEITYYSRDINKNKNINFSNVQVLKNDSDLKMIKTLSACLPIMLSYYNSLDNEIIVDGIPLD